MIRSFFKMDSEEELLNTLYTLSSKYTIRFRLLGFEDGTFDCTVAEIRGPKAEVYNAIEEFKQVFGGDTISRQEVRVDKRMPHPAGWYNSLYSISEF